MTLLIMVPGVSPVILTHDTPLLLVERNLGVLVSAKLNSLESTIEQREASAA